VKIADPTRNMTHRIHMQTCSKAYVPKPATVTPPMMSAELKLECQCLVGSASINITYNHSDAKIARQLVTKSSTTIGSIESCRLLVGCRGKEDIHTKERR
jgi:hypothetical protein